MSVAHRICCGCVAVGGVIHRDVRLVAPADDHIALGDAVAAPGGHRGRSAADGVIVDTPVKRIGQLFGVADQQGIVVSATERK